MWEMKLSDGTKRVFKVFKSLSYDKQRCMVCGQYFNHGENFYLVIPPSIFKSKYKKLSLNLAVHCDDWNSFCKDLNEDELIDKIIKYRTPKVRSFTEEELYKLECFKKACWVYDFKQEYTKPFGVKMKRSGSSLNITYNAFSDNMKIDYKGRKGLFDGFYLHQITANVYNKMHEYLGDGLRNNYSASEEIKNVFDKVNNMIK